MCTVFIRLIPYSFTNYLFLCFLKYAVDHILLLKSISSKIIINHQTAKAATIKQHSTFIKYISVHNLIEGRLLYAIKTMQDF